MGRAPADTLRCSCVPDVTTESLSHKPRIGDGGTISGPFVPPYTGVFITTCSRTIPSPLELDGAARDAEFVPELLYERSVPEIPEIEGSPPSDAIFGGRRIFLRSAVYQPFTADNLRLW